MLGRVHSLPPGGGNCFLNGGGSGTVSSGALSLRYDNCGWFGSDVNTDLSAYTHLVVRIKGAAGGEQAHFNLSLGGVKKVFGDFTLDGGGHPAITTAYQDIRIPMSANGINRASPRAIRDGLLVRREQHHHHRLPLVPVTCGEAGIKLGGRRHRPPFVAAAAVLASRTPCVHRE
ncbi:hypothetical protein [Nonomuraea sp. CA-141351]|uniref:hypothetical protein n=1 Tax=Nonomuraea sp. CA-141351 TaxID=3239996 RepID=UPI003D8D9DC9